jgi:sensor histidine kinase YesM
MRFLLLFVVMFFLSFSDLKSQNLIDSIINISNSYDDIHLKIDYLKKISKEKKFDTISMILLEEAKIYASAYRLPLDVDIYKSLGEKYTANFMFSQAIQVYDTLENYYRKKNDLKNRVITIDEKARNYLRAGRQDSALECYLRAEKLVVNTKDDFLKFKIYYNFAHFYLITSPLNFLAHSYLDYCLQIAEKLNDDSLRIEYCMERGRLYVYSEKYDSADYYFNETQRLIDKRGGYHKIDQFYNSLAVYHQLKGNKDQALEYYLKSYSLNLADKNYIGLYVNSYNLHEFYKDAKDFGNAEKYLLLGLKYAEITHVEQYKIATYEQLHLFYAVNNNFQKAYEYLLLKNKAMESMHNKELSTKIADLSIQYDVLKTQDEVKILTQENQIQSLKIRNDKLIIYGLIVLLLGIALYFVLIFRQNRIKTKQKTDELTLKNLIQQMNPHFIFNTLNSIQYYMYNHSELDTNDYISKFATLIRRILDNSNMNSISLSEELETVVLYIELEQLRFNQSFEYQINIGHDIHSDEIKIPSMFIQPFVENAIIHGLRHSTQKGMLIIDVKINGEILECSIEDNGIGRNQSDYINSQKEVKHNSLALTIANERLKLLSSIHNKKLNIRFLDKIENTDFCGTKVIVELPIIKN